ncbi:hypothetical protein HOD08_01515 [bacterium]|nr:hypothetical protein [bacterium]
MSRNQKSFVATALCISLVASTPINAKVDQQGVIYSTAYGGATLLTATAIRAFIDNFEGLTFSAKLKSALCGIINPEKEGKALKNIVLLRGSDWKQLFSLLSLTAVGLASYQGYRHGSSASKELDMAYRKLLEKTWEYDDLNRLYNSNKQELTQVKNEIPWEKRRANIAREEARQAKEEARQANEEIQSVEVAKRNELNWERAQNTELTSKNLELANRVNELREKLKHEKQRTDEVMKQILD